MNFYFFVNNDQSKKLIFILTYYQNYVNGALKKYLTLDIFYIHFTSSESLSSIFIGTGRRLWQSGKKRYAKTLYVPRYALRVMRSTLCVTQ